MEIQWKSQQRVGLTPAQRADSGASEPACIHNGLYCQWVGPNSTFVLCASKSPQTEMPTQLGTFFSHCRSQQQRVGPTPAQRADSGASEPAGIGNGLYCQWVGPNSTFVLCASKSTQTEMPTQLRRGQTAFSDAQGSAGRVWMAEKLGNLCFTGRRAWEPLFRRQKR